MNFANLYFKCYIYVHGNHIIEDMVEVEEALGTILMMYPIIHLVR